MSKDFEDFLQEELLGAIRCKLDPRGFCEAMVPQMILTRTNRWSAFDQEHLKVWRRESSEML